MFTAKELRQKYLNFFKEKNHKIISSASLVPENDPTVLFTTAGMHPLVPYLLGEKHPMGKRLVSAQKCIRTGDIDDVGDNRHLTFFEMLGNWSLGDYFKKEAIEWSFEFLTSPKWLALDPKRIYVTVFSGDKKNGVEKDEESIKIWQEQFQKINLSCGVCELNQKAKKDSRIFLLGSEDNFWGPAGKTGPCGPCTEMFYDVHPEKGFLEGTHDELVCDFRLMEIWNDVFMEFDKKESGIFEKMNQQNVDTGMGLERTITVLSGKKNVFDTDLFEEIFDKLIALINLKNKKKSDFSYKNSTKEEKRALRIIADHIKASVFILAEGITPSNTERGYVLRRLIRRSIRQGYCLGIKDNFLIEIAKVVVEMYQDFYPEVEKKEILEELEKEENKFRKTLEAGIKIFDKIITESKNQEISGKEIFNLYQTYGFPIELIKELASEKNIAINEKEFNEELKKHQELSRTASAGMFKGGLADNKEETTKLHTVTHLMLSGLRKILGEHIIQKGANINGERIRFDFSHNEKMTEEQKKAVADFVNEAISSKTEVIMQEMTLEDAKKQGAHGIFQNKYGEKVKIYTIGNYSKEICGGPHVKNTSEIKGIFKIEKEESSSSGVRRIKAVIE